MDFQHERAIIDACSTITLVASGRFREVLREIPIPVMVSRYVRGEEAGYIYGGPPDDVRSVKEPIDLNPFVEEGLIHEVTLESDHEKATFVRLAGRMDDGEARTIAIAIHRKWTVVTDDRRAIRAADDTGLQVATSPELLKHWAEGGQPTDAEIAEALRSAELRGAYLIGKRHPLYDWWQEQL